LLKQAAIVPVFERGRTSSVGNYRSIPILKIFPTFLDSSYTTMFLTFIDLNYTFPSVSKSKAIPVTGREGP
jgi:hypothetical protein